MAPVDMAPVDMAPVHEALEQALAVEAALSQWLEEELVMDGVSVLEGVSVLVPKLL